MSSGTTRRVCSDVMPKAYQYSGLERALQGVYATIEGGQDTYRKRTQAATNRQLRRRWTGISEMAAGLEPAGKFDQARLHLMRASLLKSAAAPSSMKVMPER